MKTSRPINKMPCPVCGHGHIDSVVDSRPYTIAGDDMRPFSGVQTIKRTRKCDICGHREVTFEVTQNAIRKVEKGIINGLMVRLFGMMQD